MYNTLWYVGSIVAAWTVFGTIGYDGDAAWRVPVALQALMPLIQFLGIWLLPESPRWLCSKDRDEDALKVLIKVSGREKQHVLRWQCPHSALFGKILANHTTRSSTPAATPKTTLSEPSLLRSDRRFSLRS